MSAWRGGKKKDNQKPTATPSVTHNKTEKWIQDDFNCENDGNFSQCSAWCDSAGADPRSHTLLVPRWAELSKAQPQGCSQPCPGVKAQGRAGELQPSQGSFECCLRSSSTPHSPACSWLPACLETRKLTGSNSSVMRHPWSWCWPAILSGALQQILHHYCINHSSARNPLCSTAERKQPSKNFP